MPGSSDVPNGFDYIVVGSGAGGGPLAARLVEQEFRVLVIEAGPDHSVNGGPPLEVTLAPGFLGLSNEHVDVSWEFFVKHYTTPPTGPDPKEHESPDPARRGIFYPRATGLGGCTIHNAMITAVGPDSDWEELADFVDDDTWRSQQMRGYFRQLERNEYLRLPTRPPTRWFGRVWDLARWVVGYPADHARGRHGFRGWLHTSTTDLAIGLADRQLVSMLKAALWRSKIAGLDRAWTLVSRFFRGRIFEKLDPNHARTQAEHPEGVVTIPLAVCGPRTTIHQNSATPFVMRGRRSSPRELLLETRAAHPDRLEIWTDTLATKVLFADGGLPRAIGVSYRKGARLYRAHQKPSESPGENGTVFVRPGGEVILCGGAFNTPQLLMLSGLGDPRQLDRFPNACTLTGRDGQPLRDAAGRPRRIDLPGVGRNLQDRYEVTVISEMRKDFSLLEGASFKLPDAATPVDRHLKQWRAEGTGLYTSNGSVLGILKRSQPDLDQPDLFMFGLPLPFYGYQVGFSKVGHIHNKFTWAILKAHTSNGDGTVELRSADPLDTPLVNFHYFNEQTHEGEGDVDPDLQPIVEGVKFVRGISKAASGWFFGRVVKGEIHPGDKAPPDDDQKIRDWIRQEAWGHHACGTCRMGPPDDAQAVLDSRFKVRQVIGLRVVDASIFPRIPGFFIVSNVYMASEKAADVIAEDGRRPTPDSEIYPHDLRDEELKAIRARRAKVALDPVPGAAPDGEPATEATWSRDVTGLALSGGGVRSATFNLGLLQALARGRWLRRVDFMSTVSGGGYIGSFLGRAFDQLREAAERGEPHASVRPSADRVEADLQDSQSPPLQWLRKHANYIAPSGNGDGQVNAAIFIRNFLSVHVVVGLLLFTIFGGVNAIRYGLLSPLTAALSLFAMDQTELPLAAILKGLIGPFFSPWFIAFELLLWFMVLPRMIGYWIVSQDRHGRYSAPPLIWMFVAVGALLYAAVRNGLKLPLAVVAVAPLVAFIHVELAWARGRRREEAVGRGGVETQRLRTRNLLTYDLGVALAIAGAFLAFTVIDTIAHAIQQAALARNRVYFEAFAALLAAAAALAPITRFVAGLFTTERKTAPRPTIVVLLKTQAMAFGLAAVLLFIPLVLVAFAAHAAYAGGLALGGGIATTLVALGLSFILALPGALVFVNRSSLAQTYAARLARTYLGATNPRRHRPEGRDITEVMAGDDQASIRDYRPHVAGGPLHLINVMLNQTIDFTSQRGNRDRKGENLAVSSIGMTIGTRWHGAWAEPAEDWKYGSARKRPTSIRPLGHRLGTDHPLIDQTGHPTEKAEMLSLRQWMAISGAAMGPGRGQSTELGTALLFGLANIRTGYWWNSGLTQAARDGFPSVSFLARTLYALQELFLTQTLLLGEWMGRYPGPWGRFWHLSDGGFFDNLGAYELIRRRVPRIIVGDASADPRYSFGAFANLVRKVRIDFDAEIEAFSAEDYNRCVPAEVRPWLGTLRDLAPQTDHAGRPGPSARHATLCWVRYLRHPNERSVLLYMKASLTGDEPIDIEQYRGAYPEFPHEGTADQFFEEAQWESYRHLGMHVANPLVDNGRWFWAIPL